ncbi:MAG: DUF4124 domain-containing protein [Gallionella sp.]
MNDETTDMTTSHLTSPGKDTGQVIGYSHSTRLSKDDSQVAGYNFKLLIAIFVGISFSLPVMAKLYKWVDEKGVTHYGETIPPEYADRDRAELNQSGRTVKVIEVPTAAERKAQEAADEKKRADKKAAIEQKRRDQTLTSTYSNSSEIELARNRNLQQVNARINNNASQLKMATDSLLSLQKESESYTISNKEIPSALHDDLTEAQARVDLQQKNLDKSLADKTAIEARYDADKARYHELTGK